MSESRVELWTDADPYDRFMGRWSRIVAERFLEWIEVPGGSTWLDIACGTGIISAAILERHDPARIDGFDVSPRLIDSARRKITDTRASFRAADAADLPTADASFDAVVCGLALNLMHDQAGALSEFVRSARKGGLVAAYVWDFDGGMQLLDAFWSVAKSLDPEADRERDISGFAICHPDRLREAFANAGLSDVDAGAIEIELQFRDFDDYWSPFLQGAAASQAHVASLTDKRRTELRERLRASLPIARDGSIALAARAWAVKGTK